MSFTASGLRHRAFSVVALCVAPFTVACGAAADEQAEPQFPQAQAQRDPVGTDEAQVPEVAGTDVRAVPYPQNAQMAGDGQGETIVIGGPGDEAVEGTPSEVQADQYPDADPSALTDFRSALDPYGQWIEDPSYGTIWQPSVGVVGSDFAPYETAGHWSYGDDYTWVSDYSWGWAPFHYGRWVYATNGWGWIPGRQYAGAWTSWRTGYGAYGGYVGWAPLPPTWYWRGGSAVGIGVVPPAPYAFCRTGDLFASSLGGRMVGGPEVAAIGANTRPMQGSMVAGGRTGAYGGSYGGGAFGGRTVAHPEIAGPSPASMHIAANAVVRPPTNNAGLNRAAQFAHPSTAVALGAHGPAGWNGGAGRAVASRPFASSMGTSAYGSYRGFHAESRTIGGGGGAVDRTYVGGHAISAFHGGGAYTYGGGSHISSFHGGGVHGGGGIAAPASHYQPYYGGGYHPSASGGHFGGHGGGGGGGHGGGHR